MDIHRFPRFKCIEYGHFTRVTNGIENQRDVVLGRRGGFIRENQPGHTGGRVAFFYVEHAVFLK